MMVRRLLVPRCGEVLLQNTKRYAVRVTIATLVTFFACTPAGSEQHVLGTGSMQMDPNPPPPNDNVPTWWDSVEPIVRSECWLCHASPPLYGAPMPLVSYIDVQAAAWSDPTRKVHQLMVDRIRGVPGKPLMPPPANGMLTAAQIDLIARWSAAGAPEGTQPPDEAMPPIASSRDAGTSAPPSTDVDAGSSDPNPEAPYQMVTATAPGAAIATGTTDSYGCFRNIVHVASPVHAIEISPIIDKAQVVHHILLFRDRQRTYPAEKDGLFCALDTIGSPSLELLTGWAPGGDGLVMPPEAGIRLDDGDYLIVQIHYNNPSGPPVVDRSGMSFKTTAHLRPNDAAVVGIGSQSFILPAGQASVSASGTCSISQAMTTFVYSPHMHLLGRKAKLELLRGGQVMPLADVENFAFEAQIHYPGSWKFQPGDSVRGTCTWDTTSRTAPTPFGEGTTDEMCYIFVAHYPPIGKVTCVN
jgi:hypothetical protein